MACELFGAPVIILASTDLLQIESTKTNVN